MRTINVQPLSCDGFSKYGSFASFLNPTGVDFGGFFRDQVLMSVSGAMPIGYSPLVVQKPEKMIVTMAEYHDYAAEIVLPLDDDAVVHVAPAGQGPTPALTEAFYVPKGTVVCLRPGVWHLSALPVHEAVLHVLIGLPERTYHNDCVVVEYAPADHMELVL